MKTYMLTIKIPEPFDFRLTVRKPAGWHWATPLEVFEDKVLYTAMRLSDDTLVGLKMRASGGEVAATLHSRQNLSDGQREELAKRISLGLGADEDLRGFYSLGKSDPLVARVTNDLHGMHTGLAGDIFERAILAILLQMAPMARSNKMMGALLENFGEQINVAGKKVIYWPAAEKIAALPSVELAKKCNLGYRAKFITALAGKVADGFPDILELKNRTDADAAKIIQTLPGIGPYSTQIISPHFGFPLDVWSSRIFFEILFGTTPAKPRKAIAMVEKEAEHRWGRYRRQVFVYVLHDLPNLIGEYGITKPV